LVDYYNSMEGFWMHAAGLMHGQWDHDRSGCCVFKPVISEQEGSPCIPVPSLSASTRCFLHLSRNNLPIWFSREIDRSTWLRWDGDCHASSGWSSRESRTIHEL
jgi:hypothetical protein